MYSEQRQFIRATLAGDRLLSPATVYDALSARVAESVGFRPVYVGPLTAARELESLAFLNIRMQVISNGSWNTQVKLVNPPAMAMAA